MRSKEFKEMIQEIQEELGLPYEAVYEAVNASYNNFVESVVNIETRHVKTIEEYDKLPNRVGIKFLGSMKKMKFTQFNRKNKAKYNNYERV